MFKYCFGASDDPKMCIGGKPEEIAPLWLSVYNWGGCNGELLDFGDSEIFQYFYVTRKSYMRARSAAFINNWPMQGQYKGKRGGACLYKLCQLKAKKELDNMETYNFLATRDRIEPYNFGTLEKSLAEINGNEESEHNVNIPLNYFSQMGKNPFKNEEKNLLTNDKNNNTILNNMSNQVQNQIGSATAEVNSQASQATLAPKAKVGRKVDPNATREFWIDKNTGKVRSKGRPGYGTHTYRVVTVHRSHKSFIEGTTPVISEREETKTYQPEADVTVEKAPITNSTENTEPQTMAPVSTEAVAA